ncbi:MAG: ABC-F family ATP-binding cassette domain-containing protein [Chloroflexi bacterium]|nr:ABC-F family ATP-binding cassette domain-containing protein [Chloroflexota bacterium]
MTLLSASQLKLFYGEVEIFSGVDLEVHERARIGLVGPNGGGKTTLLRTLIGELDANGGTVSRGGGLRLGYVPQVPDAAGTGTLKDEIMTAFDGLIKLEKGLAESASELEQSDDRLRRQAERRYSSRLEQYQAQGGHDYLNRMERVVDGVGLTTETLETPTAVASGGQRTRAALAQALLTDPDLLVLDEPTNYLDFKGLEWLEGFLSNFEFAVMVVSHDRYFLDKVATEIWELDHGRLLRFPGNYTKYRELKHAQLERQEKEYARQQEYIAKEESFIQRYKAGQRSKEARGRETRLARLERLQPPRKVQPIRITRVDATRTGHVVVSFQDLRVGFDDEGGTVELVRVPNTELERGSRTAIVGSNGVGKTTLLRTILGLQPPLTGAVTLGHNVQIGYLQQGTDGLPAGVSVLDALLQARNVPIAEARDYLARYLFQGDDVFSLVDSLSGGERTRLALARLLLTDPNVLVLDEPTTHLDIPSREALEATLADYKGALLFVSHDRHFISIMAEQIWAIENGTIELFPGTFAEWKQSREPATPAPVSKRARARHRRRERETRKLEKKAAAPKQTVNHEAIIEKLESQLADIERKLETASARQDMDAITRLGDEHRNAQEAIERAWEAWSG